MSVYFAYRSPHLAPAGKYLKRFDDATVADWFAARWWWITVPDEETLERRVNRELGCKGHAVHRLFLDRLGPSPRTAGQLVELAEEAEVEEAACESSHCLQVEMSMAGADVERAYFFFDDHYLSRNRKRAAYLLNEGWRLPEHEGKERFRRTRFAMPQGPDAGGRGATYAVLLCAEDIVGCYRELVGGHLVSGVRLAELARYLIETENVDWIAELGLLRALLPVPRKGAKAQERAFLERLRVEPADNATWGAYSDWLQEQGEPPAGPYLLRQALLRAGWEKQGVFANDYAFWDDLAGPVAGVYEGGQYLAAQYDRCRGTRPQVHVGEHLAQMCARRAGEEGDIYDQWILFDDVWAAGQPDLANAILCFAERWDVLSVK
jgi:uncharacterized protein (TIGR02996 family)